MPIAMSSPAVRNRRKHYCGEKWGTHKPVAAETTRERAKAQVGCSTAGAGDEGRERQEGSPPFLTVSIKQDEEDNDAY